MYSWTFVMRNGNKYVVKTEEKNIKEMLNNYFPKPLNEYSFSLFQLAIQVERQNFILIRFNEISEILWIGIDAEGRE